jgi:hypothetical protein
MVRKAISGQNAAGIVPSFVLVINLIPCATGNLRRDNMVDHWEGFQSSAKPGAPGVSVSRFSSLTASNDFERQQRTLPAETH